MSITRFLKQQKRGEVVPRPDVYADAWRAIVSFLDWPERLSMRVVCKDFYSKQQGLQLVVINAMIIEELLPYSFIRRRRYGDDDMSNGPRHQCLPLVECPYHNFIEWEDVDTIYDHLIHFNNAWDDSGYLLQNAVVTIRCFTQQLTGFFYGNTLDNEPPRKEKARDRVQVLGGSTSIVRAARISGFLKMPRPKNWNTLFE